ncbi:hypothetical protein BDZ89DRAFT_336653 [Hymenopellis radicata]|nr:hypothetical protein BDZ89DRAFT_336653 [Hymenopellis radicata]
MEERETRPGHFSALIGNHHHPNRLLRTALSASFSFLQKPFICAICTYARVYAAWLVPGWYVYFE